MMKLFGRYMSPFVRRAAVTARHYGLAYENVALSTIDDRDGIRTVNPVTRVPALELPDGTVIVDSSVIIDHFDRQVEPDRRLVPASGHRRTEILSLTAIALGAAEKMILRFYEQHRRPAEFVYRPWVDACLDQMNDGLAHLEARLNGPWIAGGVFSHADIAAAVTLSTLHRIDADIGAATAGRFPRLSGLTDRCEEMPAFLAAPLPAN